MPQQHPQLLQRLLNPAAAAAVAALLLVLVLETMQKQ
jgi:hypothetical protein